MEEAAFLIECDDQQEADELEAFLMSSHLGGAVKVEQMSRKEPGVGFEPAVVMIGVAVATTMASLVSIVKAVLQHRRETRRIANEERVCRLYYHTVLSGDPQAPQVGEVLKAMDGVKATPVVQDTDLGKLLDRFLKSEKAES
jgi:hypothetical protein